MTMITDAAGINIVRLLALRGALRLELAGMKRRGPSAYAVIKREFNLKGSRERVLSQFDALIEAKKQERANAHV